jgi:hypothetical protein
VAAHLIAGRRIKRFNSSPKCFGDGHVAELTKSAHESFAGPQEVAHCAKPDLRS